MKNHEIIKRISPELREKILRSLWKEEKEVYKTAVSSLAPQYNVRPVFVLQKLPADRDRWLANALARKTSEMITGNVLQIWLAATHKEMFIDFLDTLNIPHDENGLVDELPDSPPREELEKAIQVLLEKYPTEEVALYLHAFDAMDEGAWKDLPLILQENEQLRLPEPA